MTYNITMYYVCMYVYLYSVYKVDYRERTAPKKNIIKRDTKTKQSGVTIIDKSSSNRPITVTCSRLRCPERKCKVNYKWIMPKSGSLFNYLHYATAIRE